MKKDTLLVHSGRHPEDNFGIVNPPVYHASTVDYDTVAKMKALRENPNDNFGVTEKNVLKKSKVYTLGRNIPNGQSETEIP